MLNSLLFVHFVNHITTLRTIPFFRRLCLRVRRNMATSSFSSTPASSSPAAAAAFRQAVTHPAVSIDVASQGPAPFGFAPVAPLDAIPQGLSGAPSFSGGPLVVARRDTKIKALSLHCCHKEAELSLGDIEDAGGRFSVKCPRHRKKFPGGLNFDCDTGAAWCAGKPEPNAWNDSWGKKGDVAVYETKEEGGWLWASVEPKVGINRKKVVAAKDCSCS